MAAAGLILKLPSRPDRGSGASLPAAENGEIVAAQLEGTGGAEATVKTLQRLDGHAWLMPHNPAYQPIPADGAIISGKVVAVVRPTRPTSGRRRG